MYNRDVNAIARHLTELAKSLYDEPSKWAVVMRATQAVAAGIKEKNPGFDAEGFIARVRGF
jgi:hypothetical protein